jgi:PAS domain S-box-containing protein
MDSGADRDHDGHAVLEAISVVSVDVKQAHVEVVCGPELPVDIAAALLTRVTEACAAGETDGRRVTGAPAGGARFVLASAGARYTAVSVRSVSGPGTLAFLCAPTFSAVGLAASGPEALTAARFLARAPIRSEAGLRAMLEATNDGVWVVGPDFRTTWTNAAVKSLLGYTDAELAALSPLDLAHPEDHAHVSERQAARRDGESMMGEVRMIAKDGRTVWMLPSSAPIKDAAGAFLGAIAIFKDVTLHKEEQARAKRSDARMQESQRLEVLARLAGGIAHDFNNLLTAVLTGADILAGNLHAEQVAERETVEAIRQAGQRANGLCRQLLGLSGRGRFSMGPVDVLATVTEAIRALRPSLDARHVVELSGATGASDVARAPVVLADETQIQQLVKNLILNASEAIGARPGIIGVRVEQAEVDRQTLAEAHLAPDLPQGTYLKLTVTDDGPGFADGVRDRLFEPFVTTRTTGRGLGLPAVLGIVRGHGGAIRVRSAPSSGADVEVFIPIAEAPSTPRSRPPVTTAVGQGQLVLVVDDEDLVRNAVCRILRARGFRTLAAEDGVVGVDLFRTTADRVAVVLVDLSMPRMDGVETLARIRAIRPGIPAVIMSGYSEDEAAARLVGVGFATFVAKPFTAEELVRRIRGALVIAPS